MRGFLSIEEYYVEKWMEEGFIHPEKAGVQRIRSYVLAPHWVDI